MWTAENNVRLQKTSISDRVMDCKRIAYRIPDWTSVADKRKESASTNIFLTSSEIICFNIFQIKISFIDCERVNTCIKNSGFLYKQ